MNKEVFRNYHKYGRDNLFIYFLLQCYSAEVLFESFSFESNRLNQTSFERICPAIVQQIESKSCESGKEDSSDESESKAKGKHLHVPFMTLKGI